ncbi:RNA polymerase sigma factor [Psychroserpens luteus]|uniref:RNA polymerase sigma factor n=1 Tax=Psychroserpens luteus TaxID=1434066 RepID=A0ABW5ZTZ4_9FLAO|nr:RNA polymerase sigma factor [Psychroserpens luteus]
MKTITDIKNLTDVEIVDIIKSKKNTQYFGELYDRYVNKVLNKCLGFCKSIQEAEDLTQDVFIHAYTKLHTFKSHISFRQWLFVLTYNFCVNYVNRDKNRKMSRASVELTDANELLIDVDDNSLFQLKEQQLEKALEIITPEDKMIVLLKYQDDLSIKELQIIFDLGESAIKMRLKRAKSRLIQAYNTL